MAETLLDVDYILTDDKPVIRLFLKGEGGRKVKEVRGFEPYFYAVPDSGIDELERGVKSVAGVIKVERKRMTDISKEVDVLKIFTRSPKDVPILRDKVRSLPGCSSVREADIPFARRYLIDSGLIPMENLDEVALNSAAIDIEVYTKGGEPRAEKDQVICISYADSNGNKKVWTYRTLKGLDLDYVEVLQDEKAMIEAFVKAFDKFGVDIILGYNTDNFDFPYLKDRASKLGMDINIGADGSGVKLEKRGMNLGARVKGRPHVDLYPVSRRLFNLSRYRLEDVYAKVSGKEKKDIKVSEISKFWDSKEVEELRSLFEYSLSDAEAVLSISETVLPLQFELSRITRQLVFEVSRMGSGQRVESLLMVKAYEQNMLVPNRRGGAESDEEDVPFEGAYVVEPEKGLHDNIIVFDFRSLYPSIIVSHNVDLSTLDCECCKDDGYISPNNHHFCKRKEGFIPKILDSLIKRRIDAKKMLKAAKTDEERRLLEVQQQALKLLANSMYGYYGFQMARWYCRPCAESITAWGRHYIQKTIKEAGEEGFRVIYGDTDSIFITKASVTDIDAFIKQALNFGKKVNEKLPEAMELEMEGFYPRGLFITKKRYALIDSNDKIIVKGLETKRRDWAKIAKRTQDGVLNALLKDRNPDNAVDIVRTALDDIKNGRVNLNDLTIHTQMTRNIGEYVQPGPHIIAAKKAMKEGLDFKQGSIIPYVITKGGGSISDKAKVLELTEEGEYDPDYYINNQVLPAVVRILEALGYSEDELKGLGKQTTLGDW
ncbi:MAG: DNA-directed DNA polymerase [Candidatus Altiarchaeota archaeon]